MGLDIKEKNFLKFIARTLLPLVAVVGVFVYYTGLWRDPVKLLGSLLLMVWAVKLIAAARLWLKVKYFPAQPKSYGDWAIVTGATAGIGEAFAFELAANGMNLLLISRSQNKLEDVRDRVLKAHPTIAVKLLAYDFTDRAGADAFYERLKSEAGALSGGVGVLVNNVGTVNGNPEYMHLLDEPTTAAILQVNVEGTVRMTRTIAPLMIERKKGAIINVSSGSGNHPTPLITCYASTKAFITQFSQCMSHELREFGIDVIVITPYYVISNQFRRKAPTYIAPAAETVVKETLPLLGYVDKAYPYFVHAACGALVNVYWDVGGKVMMAMKRTRLRCMEMAEKKAKAS